MPHTATSSISISRASSPSRFRTGSGGGARLELSAGKRPIAAGDRRHNRGLLDFGVVQKAVGSLASVNGRLRVPADGQRTGRSRPLIAVDFVDEQDGGGFLFGVDEGLAHGIEHRTLVTAA